MKTFVRAQKGLLKTLRGILLPLFALPTLSSAQEISYSDYMQPMRDFTTAKVNFDNTWTSSYFCSGWGSVLAGVVTGYSGNGYGVKQWPVEGDLTNNGSAGFYIGNLVNPKGQNVAAYDGQFMYKSSTGAPTRFRIDLLYYISGTTFFDPGTAANGGIVNLTSTTWSRFRFHRTKPNGITQPVDRIRIVAIQNDGTPTYPHIGANYDPNAVLAIDNVKVTVASRLRGLNLITGTSNKDLGTVKFLNNGTGVESFSSWIQNLGGVDILNIFGPTDISGGSTAVKNTSNLVTTSLDILGLTRSFTREQLTDAGTSVDNSTWLGSGVPGSSTTDRFYGYLANPPANQYSYLFRQVVNGSSYSSYVRVLNGSLLPTNTFATEVSVNLGGEQIVGVGDFNCDGSDDFVTRSNGNHNVRLFQNNTGVWPLCSVSLASPYSVSNNGFLSCLAVADIDGDGFDDMLVTDLVSGDVFSLLCKPSGGTLTWLFQLSAAAHEKFYALADADNDGLPEIYTTRKRPGDGVGEIDTRKLAFTTANPPVSIVSYDPIAEYDYDNFRPCAIGDINNDGSADVVMIKYTNSLNDVLIYLVNPANRYCLPPGPIWACYASTSFVRPFSYYGAN